MSWSVGSSVFLKPPVSSGLGDRDRGPRTLWGSQSEGGFGSGESVVSLGLSDRGGGTRALPGSWC